MSRRKSSIAPYFRYLLVLLLLIVPGYFASLYGPWWSVAIIGCAIGFLLDMTPTRSFFTGFLAIALLWGVMAFWINADNNGIMATRIGGLFGGLSPILLILVTALIGGLAGGLGTLTGRLARAAFFSRS